MLESEIQNLLAEMEEKNSRKEKTEKEIADAKYAIRIAEWQTKIKANEELRETLYEQQKALSLQSESRASVDIKRKDVKAKTQEIRIVYVCIIIISNLIILWVLIESWCHSSLQTHNSKFKSFTGKDATPETMERELANASQCVISSVSRRLHDITLICM